MASEWAYKIARNQRRDVETMATNLDATRIEGLEEAAKIAESETEDQRTFVIAIGKLIAEDIRVRIKEMKG